MTEKLNITIVEDHKLVASLLQKQLGRLDFVTSVSVYNSSKTFLGLCDALDFDTLFVDLLMPEVRGEIIIEKIRANPKKTHVKILVLSGVTHAMVIKDTIALGANAYLTKDIDIREIQAALKTIYEDGNVYLAEGIKDAFIQGQLNPKYNILLTPKEREVLLLTCEGKSINEIAETLHLSTHSIQSYIKRLFVKFDVNKTSTLILAAIRMSLYVPDK